MADRSLAAVSVREADDDGVGSGGGSCCRRVNLISELASDLGDVAVLAKVESDFSLGQLLRAVDEGERIKSKNVGIHRHGFANRRTFTDTIFVDQKVVDKVFFVFTPLLFSLIIYSGT
jgi:hypothetical protein